MLKWFKKKPDLRCAAIIAAGGSGVRMGGGGKQLIPIGGVPMLVRTLMAFEQAASVEAVVVAAREEEIPEIARLVADCRLSKVTGVVRGGESRIQSVAAGLAAVPTEYGFVAIHDGARPLVSPALIDKVIEAAASSGAAAAAVSPVDTVRKKSGTRAGEDLDRASLVLMQTPQVFSREEYDVAIAYALTQAQQFTDDVAVYRTVKNEVTLVDGERTNIKITEPLDILMAELFLEELV
ncbi:MAG TPA: 2-C-methyl-D-erythritol 4-phosphate cytidylyltransferase [Candidatus Acidoferrum sp.]|nr:2-C-methyl-D-erythritol 4-phosphate cytidylyltransferase [Candidatus Acidoferrum sp.]